MATHDSEPSDAPNRNTLHPFLLCPFSLNKFWLCLHQRGIAPRNSQIGGECCTQIVGQKEKSEPALYS